MYSLSAKRGLQTSRAAAVILINFSLFFDIFYRGYVKNLRLAEQNIGVTDHLNQL